MARQEGDTGWSLGHQAGGSQPDRRGPGTDLPCFAATAGRQQAGRVSGLTPGGSESVQIWADNILTHEVESHKLCGPSLNRADGRGCPKNWQKKKTHTVRSSFETVTRLWRLPCALTASNPKKTCQPFDHGCLVWEPKMPLHAAENHPKSTVFLPTDNCPDRCVLPLPPPALMMMMGRTIFEAQSSLQLPLCTWEWRGAHVRGAQWIPRGQYRSKTKRYQALPAMDWIKKGTKSMLLKKLRVHPGREEPGWTTRIQSAALHTTHTVHLWDVPYNVQSAQRATSVTTRRAETTMCSLHCRACNALCTWHPARSQTCDT